VVAVGTNLQQSGFTALRDHDSVVLFNDERARRQRPCSDDLLPLVLALASPAGDLKAGTPMPVASLTRDAAAEIGRLRRRILKA
jgi:hypothetical protein